MYHQSIRTDKEEDYDKSIEGERDSQSDSGLSVV